MTAIRNAAIQDFKMIQPLEELMFQIHRSARPDYFKDLTESYTQTDFEEFLSLPDSIALVAVCQERIVGLCFGSIRKTAENPFCRSRKIAFIDDLVTLPEYRGQGVASSLLARAKELAVHENAEAIELCVWDFNQAALKLYRKLGMTIQYSRMEFPLPIQDPAQASDPQSSAQNQTT